MDLLMVVRESVELQAVERDALLADRDFCEVWTNLGVESVLIHTEVGRDVPEADKPPRGIGRWIGGISHGPSLIAAPPVVDQKVRFESSRLRRALDGSPDLEVPELAGGSQPWAVKMPLPVRLPAERDHQHADRQPVTVAGRGIQSRSGMLEIPADVLDAPLVRADMPATVDDDRD